MFSIITALWLGILTSISPCPLATNIAAISFIGKDVVHPKNALLSGLLYVLGRVFSYVVLGIIIILGLLSIPSIANFFQEYINFILGPILVIVGIILLDILKINFNFGVSENKAKTIVQESGIWGAFLIGVIFALSFCPVSAALFFGSLIPLAIEQNSKILLPLSYGVGTGLPVIVFAFIIAFSFNSLGKAYNKLKEVEVWIRRITGVIFLLAGVYYIIIHIFNLGG